MADLLDLAVSAHGGWKRWQRLAKVTCHAGLGGTIWALKGHAGTPDVRITAALHAQHVELEPFKAAGTQGVYEPGLTTIRTSEGRLLESRQDPRASFAGHQLQTQWSDLQLLYFRGYAAWTYLTTPFLLKEPGFITEEIEPWSEDGEEWRRLQATFPANVPSHSTRQIFYFDAKGLLRRHDYSVDIIGGSASAHYVHDHQEVGGIVFPTRRRVYAYGPDNKPLLDRVAVAIDFSRIHVE